MSKPKSIKKTKSGKATHAAGRKAAKKAASPTKPVAAPTGEPKTKKLSALDAAAEVLRESGQPMRSKDLIVAMTDQGLWTSPKGKTPEATLNAAITREITAKGNQARFRKVERGQFAFNSAGSRS